MLPLGTSNTLDGTICLSSLTSILNYKNWKQEIEVVEQFLFPFSFSLMASKVKSNVWREKIKKPDPPCVVCRGSGRVDCTHCHGKGRTNEVQLEMLPKGEWPKWCRTCGGSGLGYCSRCLGTGEYRYLMGFHFMNRENSLNQDYKNFQVRDNLGKHRAEDFLLNNDNSDS